MKRTLESVLAEIRKGKGPSLLLLHGDDYLVHSASKAILDLLVPPDRRDFCLERFDGRASPWDEIEAALMTPPFLAGTKTVAVENAPYFLSREHKRELGERVLQFWDQGKRAEAARLLCDLLLLEGWTQDRWEELNEPSSSAELAALLGADETEVKAEVAGLFAFCRASGMHLSQRRADGGQRLMEFLAQGPPPWAVLLLTAANVDRRTRLYRSFEEKGWVVDLALSRERSGRISRELLSNFLDRRLKKVGKKMAAQAREMILSRAGAELWAVDQELEKLLLYVGEEAQITAEDVEETFLDQGEGWAPDLLKAIAERKAIVALGHLARLLSQGDHPLKLLGTIVSEVRRLLAARQLIETEMRGKWRAAMTYEQFQQSVLQDGSPVLTQHAYRDYMTFKNAENFTSRELLRSLEWIYRTDRRLKSSANHPRIQMERLILEMCQKQ